MTILRRSSDASPSNFRVYLLPRRPNDACRVSSPAPPALSDFGSHLSLQLPMQVEEAPESSSGSSGMIVQSENGGGRDHRLPEKRRFGCPCCPKSFLTPKAVQGRMRMHPDKPYKGMTPPAPGQDGLLALSPGPAAARRTARASRSDCHQCGKCGQVFGTGQQLGGHKRKHYDGPPIVRKSSPRKSSQVTLQELQLFPTTTTLLAGDHSPPPSGGGLEFDLNISPDMNGLLLNCTGELDSIEYYFSFLLC